MNEMIERVAIALFEEENKQISHEPWEWNEAENKEYWYKSARAAIDAMRRPTSAMVSAGDAEALRQAQFTEAANSLVVGEPIPIWRAMIDMALQ